MAGEKARCWPFYRELAVCHFRKWRNCESTWVSQRLSSSALVQPQTRATRQRDEACGPCLALICLSMSRVGRRCLRSYSCFAPFVHPQRRSWSAVTVAPTDLRGILPSDRPPSTACRTQGPRLPEESLNAVAGRTKTRDAPVSAAPPQRALGDAWRLLARPVSRLSCLCGPCLSNLSCRSRAGTPRPSHPI